jgi:hypothetical protein
VPSERPSLRPKGLQATWKVLVGIGAILGVGFGAAEYLARYQTVDTATLQHDEIKKQNEDSVKQVRADIQEQSGELESMRYINVRIEVAQKQVLDELRRSRLERQPVRSYAERTQRAEELEAIEHRIEVRADALEESYELQPVMPEDAPDREPLIKLMKAGAL